MLYDNIPTDNHAVCLWTFILTENILTTLYMLIPFTSKTKQSRHPFGPGLTVQHSFITQTNFNKGIGAIKVTDKVDYFFSLSLECLN